MKTISNQRQREEFRTQARELLLHLGAEPIGDELVFETKAGRLTLRISDYEGEIIGTLFSRFSTPQAARRLVGCNPFSGKWNHHYFNGWTVESAIEDLAHQCRRML